MTFGEVAALLTAVGGIIFGGLAYLAQHRQAMQAREQSLTTASASVVKAESEARKTLATILTSEVQRCNRECLELRARNTLLEMRVEKQDRRAEKQDREIEELRRQLAARE